MILVTAFKGKFNTSKVIVDKLSNSFDKCYLTNSFVTSIKELSRLELEKYELIIMLGINKQLKKKIHLERYALLEDKLETDVDLFYVNQLFNIQEIESSINEKPTRYLCNNAYYHTLLRNNKTVFIHVPGLSKINELDNFVSGFEEVIKELKYGNKIG